VPPFEASTAFSILFKHKMEPLISPRARNPQLSERTSEFLERCLAKCPADRFASFRDVLKHLQPAPADPLPWDALDDTGLADFLARYQARREVYLHQRGDLGEDVYEFPAGRVLRILRGDIAHER